MDDSLRPKIMLDCMQSEKQWRRRSRRSWRAVSYTHLDVYKRQLFIVLLVTSMISQYLNSTLYFVFKHTHAQKITQTKLFLRFRQLLLFVTEEQLKLNAIASRLWFCWFHCLFLNHSVFIVRNVNNVKIKHSILRCLCVVCLLLNLDFLISSISFWKVGI